MYTAEPEVRTRDHEKKDPFLYLLYEAIHSVNRPQEGLQASQEWINKLQFIKPPQRQTCINVAWTVKQKG